MKNYEHIKIKIETITPDRAKRLIESTNGENYRVSTSRRVDTYASDQARGLWLFNGDTICITDGIVHDGLHRMYSCVQSGVSFDTIVVYGLPKEVFKTKDRGLARTLVQELAHRGYREAKTLGGITTAWYQLSHNMWCGSKRKHESSSELLDFVALHELKLLDATKIARMKRDGFAIYNLIRISVFCPIILEATALTFDKPSDSGQVMTFITEFLTGKSSCEGSPAIALRNRMLRAKKSGRSHTEQISLKMLRALTIHAWNKHCTGDIIEGSLTYRLSGKSPMKFPEVEQATS